MDPDFWLARWQQGDIAFHQDRVSPDVQAWEGWLLAEGRHHRVLVPLCGKTRDVHWLTLRGHRVAGAELSRDALIAMHVEQDIPFSEREDPPFHVLESGPAHLLAGDFFELEPRHLERALGGAPDRCWDRAALVALRPDQRPLYVEKLRSLLAPGARVLLNVVVYDSALMQGPPWSVDEAEVRQLFSGAHIELFDRTDILDESPRWREKGHRWFRRDLYGITLPD